MILLCDSKYFGSCQLLWFALGQPGQWALLLACPRLPLRVYQPFLLLTILFAKIHMGMLVFLPSYTKKNTFSPLALLLVTGLDYPDPFWVIRQLLDVKQENCISSASRIVKGMKM
jgi:hypothetical protein